MFKTMLRKLKLYTFDEVKKIEKTNKDTYRKIIEAWKDRAIRAEEELDKLKNSIENIENERSDKI